MIISDSYKLIFDAYPKTGSTSTENYFRILGLSNDEVIHGTINPTQRKDWIGYLKFTIVRNPYEKTVSWYQYFYKQIKKKYPNFPTELEFKNSIQVPPFLWKQLKHSDLIKKFPETRIVRFENISTEIPKIAKEVGLDISNVEFPHLNESTAEAKFGNWREYYDSESADMVYKEFASDFEMFGYSKESWKNRIE